MKIRRSQIVAILIAAFAFVYCAQVAAAKPISSPSGFQTDYEGKLAGDGNHLWLATTGYDQKNAFRSQVQVYRGGHWVRLGKRPLTSAGYELQLAIRKGKSDRPEPCFGDKTRKENMRVRCFERGRWGAKSIPKRYRKATLNGLRADGRKVTALFTTATGRGRKQITSVQVARLKGNRFVPVNVPLNIRGQYATGFVQTTSDSRTGRVEVAASSTIHGDRWTATLGKSGWKRTKRLRGADGGNFGSTPIRSGGSLYSPLMEGSWFTWPGEPDNATMSVFRLRDHRWTPVGGEPVDHETGYPQGGVYPVGNRIWAVWQESNSEGVAFGGGIFTKVFAARINRAGTDFGKEIKLWDGRINFPGATQAIKYRGGPVFLYFRQSKPRGGLHVSIDFSHRTR